MPRGFSDQKIDEASNLDESAQLGPKFEDRNVINKELGIKVRIQVNSRGVKGHLLKCAISAFI